MPQFDAVSFSNQVNWLFLFVLLFYYLNINSVLPFIFFVKKFRLKKIYSDFVATSILFSKIKVVFKDVESFLFSTFFGLMISFFEKVESLLHTHLEFYNLVGNESFWYYLTKSFFLMSYEFNYSFISTDVA